MLYEITNGDSVKRLFGNWEETLIYSCVQQVMGKLFAVEKENPKAAMAWIGDFAFFAGKPCEELVLGRPEGFLIMVPQNKEWAEMMEGCFPGSLKRVTRYATKKNTCFDTEHLRNLEKELPGGYKLQFIDGGLYDQCRENKWSKDLVSVFESKEAFLKYGLGAVALKDGEVVSGASSYARYRDGIEIEVDTKEEERRKHLALACCAALIRKCLERGLYPSWDAHNVWSLHLAQKLGYEFSHEYIAYEGR